MAEKDHSEYYIKRVMGLGSLFFFDIENNTQQLDKSLIYGMMNTVDLAILNGVGFDQIIESIKSEMSSQGVSYRWEIDPFGRILKDLFELNLGRASAEDFDGPATELQEDEAFHKEMSGVQKLSRIIWAEKIIWLVRAADDSHAVHSEVFEYDISQARVIARAARDVLKISFADFLSRYMFASAQDEETAMSRPSVIEMKKVWEELPQ